MNYKRNNAQHNHRGKKTKSVGRKEHYRIVGKFGAVFNLANVLKIIQNLKLDKSSLRHVRL